MFGRDGSGSGLGGPAPTRSGGGFGVVFLGFERAWLPGVDPRRVRIMGVVVLPRARAINGSVRAGPGVIPARPSKYVGWPKALAALALPMYNPSPRA